MLDREKFVEVGKAELHRLAAELHGGKHAPSAKEYCEHYKPPAPSYQAIRRFAGSWSKFCDLCQIDLSYPNRGGNYVPAVPVAEMLAVGKAEMIRLSRELHDGLYAPNQAEFDQFSIETAPSRTYLFDKVGDWPTWCAWCKMDVGTDAYYWAKADARRAEWKALDKTTPKTSEQLAKEQAILARAPMGMPVKPTPRPDVWYSKRDGKTYHGLAWALI